MPRSMRRRRNGGALEAGLCLALLLAGVAPATAGPQDAWQEAAAAPLPAAASPQIFRMATLAPAGSDWAEAAREAARRVREATAGRVSIRWYLGAVMGDEATMLGRMRDGGLEGGVFSMVGLTREVPSMAFLALPFLFRDMKEAREIAQRFAPVFQERFLDRDLVLLGTFSLGFGRLFTGKKAGDLEEITALRTWVWKGDPLGEAIFRGLGFKNLVPLDMTDVLPALRYGLLDAFSGTCYTISVFQWFPHAGYMIPMNWGYTFGGIALRREAFARISPGDRDTVRRVMAELLLSVEAESLAKEEETRRILASVEGMGETQLSSHEVVLLEDRAGQVYETVAEIVQARDLLHSILGARDALRRAPRLQRAPPRVTKPASGEAWGEGPNGRLPDPQRAGTDG